MNTKADDKKKIDLRWFIIGLDEWMERQSISSVSGGEEGGGGHEKMHESIGRYSIPRVNAGNFVNVIRHETIDT